MKSQTIEITVSPTGETKIQTQGFVGNGYRESSQFLKHALGQRLSSG